MASLYWLRGQGRVTPHVPNFISGGEGEAFLLPVTTENAAVHCHLTRCCPHGPRAASSGHTRELLGTACTGGPGHAVQKGPPECPRAPRGGPPPRPRACRRGPGGGEAAGNLVAGERSELLSGRGPPPQALNRPGRFWLGVSLNFGSRSSKGKGEA